jgi:uncharacterized membrane protein
METNNTQHEVAISHVELQSHSGPLPAPEQLQKYEEVYPGTAERIIVMAEKQSDHRRALERKMVRSASRDSLCGIVSAFVLCALSLVFSFFLIRSGYQVSGTIIGGVGITSLVTVFVYGTRSRDADK